MFRSRSWFFSSNSLWKPKNPHSTEYLKYLHSTLQKHPTITEQNKPLLIEALRSIAEILIWGDQNDPTVFDLFLEKNMLSFFLKIMRQRCGSYVCVQLLQTLNILFENIRSQTSVYYLLSNNHVNSIIEHKFDFSDEEVMAYYISFLKTLSLKLNEQTIHFFYNEHTHDFPLYTEAIKFFHHPESMVRIAVRTLTLNVFKVQDDSMQKFIRDKTAAPYFSNLVNFIAEHVIEIDKLIKVVCGEPEESPSDKRRSARLDDLIAEHLDHLHYVNDILLLESGLSDVLIEQLLGILYDESLYSKISTILRLYIQTQVLSTITNPQFLLQFTQTLLLDDSLLHLDSCPNGDHTAFLYLCLLTNIRPHRPLHFQNPSLLKSLLRILKAAVESHTKVRIATVSIASELILAFVEKIEDEDLAYLEGLREENVGVVLGYLEGEELFLELFEDEYEKKVGGVGSLLADSVMLLPPVCSPLCGVGLEKRGVCGETERTRRALRLYFLLRSLSLTLRHEPERHLPLSILHRNTVQLEQCLDLTNSDLLACLLVIPKESTKLRRFLVVDQFQFILVEPSQKRMGWGVVKFVGFLQDLEIAGDKLDSRALHITVKSSPVVRNHPQKPILSGKFIFDDHIRCMAARQRLTKHRARAREKKLTQIRKTLSVEKTTADYSPPQNLRQTYRYAQIARRLPGVASVVTPGPEPE